MRLRSSIAFALVALAPLACVSSGTHEELARQHAETKERLAALQLDHAAQQKEAADAKKIAEASLASEQQRAASIEGKRQALEASLAQCEASGKSCRTDLLQTQSDLAQVVKDRSALKGSVDEMKRALDELAKRKAEADRRITEFKGLLARFKALIDAGRLRVRIVDGRMVVQLSSDILFASGSAALSKDGKVSVIEVAKVLTQIPERKFQVEGHTDNVPMKTAQFPSNWELASARALGVVRAMIEGGMPPERVSAASFAETKPAAPNDTTEGKAQNRRIEIVVVPDLSSLPGFDELQKAAGN